MQRDDVYHEHKLADAIAQPQTGGGNPLAEGAPDPTQSTVAEQQRESEESQNAQNVQGDPRDRLVAIGKANHMAGRGNGRVRDQ